MLIQALLVAVAIGFIFLIARQKATAISALKKAGLVLLGIVMIVTVIFPELTTVIAHALGIGRGTDLLLYVVTAAFLLYATTQYVRGQSNRGVMYALARRIALDEAKTRYGLNR